MVSKAQTNPLSYLWWPPWQAIFVSRTCLEIRRKILRKNVELAKMAGNEGNLQASFIPGKATKIPKTTEFYFFDF